MIPASLLGVAALVRVGKADRTVFVHRNGGFDVVRTRGHVWRRRRFVAYADLYDIEIVQARRHRMQNRAVYKDTVLTFRYVDRSGVPVATLSGTFDEPRQHELVWAPSEPLDVSTLPQLPPEHPIQFGIVSVQRFRALKHPDQGPFR